jgi:hypothetical protein
LGGDEVAAQGSQARQRISRESTYPAVNKCGTLFSVDMEIEMISMRDDEIDELAG